MPKSQSAAPSDWRDARRLRAWKLHQQGWTQRRIADELGVTQGAISQWLRRARTGGEQALWRHPAPGRRAALTTEQLNQISVLLAYGTETYGFQGERWTTARVATVLRQVFGVTYHPAHVSRLLRKYCPGWRNINGQSYGEKNDEKPE